MCAATRDVHFTPNSDREADERERTTVEQYRQHVRIHIAPALGKIKLASLTPKIVEDFRDHLLKNLSRALARKVLVSLKSSLKAANFSHVAANATIGRDKRGRRKLEVGVDIPAPSEVKRLINATQDQRTRILLLTAALTGLRASELRGLRWSDVDLKAGELHVRQRANRYFEIGAPKSESSRRSVPLDHSMLLPALKAWKLACPISEAGLVFPTPEGEIAHHETVLRSLRPVMVAAGVIAETGEAKYALHAFRHFFASWCINPVERGGRGLSAKVVQELMGHSSITMTLDLYGHLFPRGEDKDELSKAVSALLA
jgi:integrase